MGSSLGPTFADFSMPHLENKLLGQSDKKSSCFEHLQYVGNIFAIFKSHSFIRFSIERLEKNSILKFTYGGMKNNTFKFLVVKMNVPSDGSFTTSVYTKVSDTGLCKNFTSHTPENYIA